MCIYFNTSQAVKHGNVDQEEKIHLLTSYKNCLLDRFKKDHKQAEELRKSIKDKIFNLLCERSWTRAKQQIPEVQLHNIDLSYPRFPTLEEVEEKEKDKVTFTDNETWISEQVTKHTVYDLCGYLLHSRSHLIKDCAVCVVSLQTT